MSLGILETRIFSLFSSSFFFSCGLTLPLFYLFSRMRLEAALILGASVILRASSFISSTAFICFARLLSMKFFCSYRNRCSRSSARFCSSSMCFGTSFIGVASTVALRTGFFFLVASYGVNVHPCSSFSSRSY